MVYVAAHATKATTRSMLSDVTSAVCAGGRRTFNMKPVVLLCVSQNVISTPGHSSRMTSSWWCAKTAQFTTTAVCSSRTATRAPDRFAQSTSSSTSTSRCMRGCRLNRGGSGSVFPRPVGMAAPASQGWIDFDEPHMVPERVVRHIRAIDQQTAIDICCMAAMSSHDALGNILPSVWALSTAVASDKDHFIDVNDVRRFMLNQIEKHIQKRQDLIVELDENDTLVRWISQFTATWESKYREEKNEQHDISQMIFSIMQECVFQVMEFMRNTRPDAHDMLKMLLRKIEEHNTHLLYAQTSFPTPEHALARVLFRFPPYNQALCRFAAKLLQRRQGNRSGVVNTIKQLNSLNQQEDMARSSCLVVLLDDERLERFQRLVATEKTDNGVTLLHLRSNMSIHAHLLKKSQMFRQCTTCFRVSRRDAAVCDDCSNGLAP